MLYPRITKLYMYKSPDAYTLDILISGRLWAAKPEQFNDPFDDGNLKITKDFTEQDYLAATCRKYGKSDQWPSEVVQHVNENLDADGNFTPEGRDRVNKAIQDLIEENRNSGVICLSEVCDSILMWSHYAKKHTGVCFEFIRAEDNELGDEEICSPVKYERHYPQIKFLWPISRVILGARIEKWFKSCIETLCKERNIQCVQAEKSDREFRIEIT